MVLISIYSQQTVLRNSMTFTADVQIYIILTVHPVDATSHCNTSYDYIFVIAFGDNYKSNHTNHSDITVDKF